MNREDIIRMAREAGLYVEPHGGGNWAVPLVSDLPERVERFAALVAAAERKRLEATAWGASKKWIVEAVAAEREACAQTADEWATSEQKQFGNGGPGAAIRARGEE